MDIIEIFIATVAYRKPDIRHYGTHYTINSGANDANKMTLM